MSEWEYSPIENIAFALQDIVNILQKIESKMPTPYGTISTSEGPVNPDDNKQEVVEDSTNEKENEDEVEE